MLEHIQSVLGFDFGTKKAGVAIGQRITATAAPLSPLMMRDGIPVLGDLFGFVPGALWLALKISFLLLFFLWFRATFPRYRYDQIMRLGWKVFIPVTLVWILVIGLGMLAKVGPWFD